MLKRPEQPHDPREFKTPEEEEGLVPFLVLLVMLFGLAVALTLIGTSPLPADEIVVLGTP